ncbi:MAG: glutamate--cysteine ligase [Candidatus Mcinerneyibacterium aminivorans]|uniref:Glutamate--cysteine ligase n=1 Tax=Candidatus Mcinerneyibacterium aminivorans TaxID=2703815 RepID=A0A5D0MGV5_9BACT|nr:MAG: glutamate--cysteine ligase [Candidatus Mcinerneyibacterium aminivorans]
MIKKEQLELFIDFFKENITKEENFKIGAEFEHFLVKKDSLKALSYYEKNGIEDILKRLVQNGWKPKYEDQNLIGCTKYGSEISLEPGAQFELSVKPQESIILLEQLYLDIIGEIISICDDIDCYLVPMGYHPKTKIDEIPWVPKKRYDIMSEYLGKRGKLAHNMMKGTSSLQVAVDYNSEEDFANKMRVAYILGPFLSYLFDNSIYFEDEKYNKNMLRTRIWNNCDDDRCGIVPGVFDEDFGFEKYARYVLNQPPIFYIDKEGNEHPFNKPLYKVLKSTWNKKQIKHSLSMCFPHVRAREFIEIRMADALYYPLNMAYITLINNIFYNEKMIDYILNKFAGIDFNTLKKLEKRIIKKGKKAEYKGENIYNILVDIYDRALRGSKKDEKRCLSQIKELIELRTNPKKKFKNCCDSKRKIVKYQSLNNYQRCQKCINQ